MYQQNLAILKGNAPLEINGEHFEPNTYYRCFPPKELMENNYMIYGNNMSIPNFENNFEYVYDVVMREWETIGLTKNGKKITKKRFIELSDIHKYGKIQVLYIRNENIIYGFYGKCTNKKDTLNKCYLMYLVLLNGGVNLLDNKAIQRGNRGIPICYGNLKFHENILDNTKKELSLPQQIKTN
jgi:hypothetical protein